MWPNEYTELKHIENLLTCKICYEYMKTSVITSCSHNYCSLCIRKYLHYKTECPACFEETFEKDLRTNKVLDEVIEYIISLKKKLENGRDDILLQNDRLNELNSPCRSKNISQNINNVDLRKEELKAIDKPNGNVSPCIPKISGADLSSPSTSALSKVATFFTPKSKKCIKIEGNEKTVVCPVCKVDVSETNINRHLDDCLKRETIKSPVLKSGLTRKPLPKLVFNLMKDPVIRKKLKELGLSTQGDRKTMEARLQRYIVIYNAECDKLNPRAVADLIKQCEEEENIEKKMHKASSILNRFQVNRNTEQNIIEEERKKYLQAHKDSFRSLISQIKTGSPEKRPVRRAILHQDTCDDTIIPEKRQAVHSSSSNDIEGDEMNDCHPINCEIIQDTDSDDSCPLQVYSSEDPMNFVRSELSCPPNDSINQNKFKINRESTTNQGTTELTGFSNRIVKESDDIECLIENSSSTNKTKSRVSKKIDNTNLGGHDLSSNDSVDSKYNHEVSMCELLRNVDKGANELTLNSVKSGKENMRRSPEIETRTPRKRGPDAIVNTDQNLARKIRKIRKPKIYLNESNKLNDDEPNQSIVLSNDNTERLPKRTRRETTVSKRITRSEKK